jgi:fumarate hydratase subunit beta
MSGASQAAVPTVELNAPLAPESIPALHVGQRVRLSGVIYTARDAAHRRLAEALEAGQDLPIPLGGQVVYYVGPAPARPGDVIGPAGPTTAGRVDLYTPALLAHGLKGMIGKGKRSLAVRQAIAAYAAVYFVMVGGAAALIAQCIKRADRVAYADLGPEAIYRLEVEVLPMVVANDMYGADLFEMGQAEYRR